jgi:uncharacterized protein (DUF983 family)
MIEDILVNCPACGSSGSYQTDIKGEHQCITCGVKWKAAILSVKENDWDDIDTFGPSA